MNTANDKVVCLPASVSGIQIATVISVEGQTWRVECDGRTVLAQKAFSCLVVPQPDDKVLLSGDDAHSFIIAIVERPESQDMTLQVGPETSVTGAQNLALHSAETTTLVSHQINQVATKQVVKADELITEFNSGVVSGQQLHAKVGRLHVISDWINTLAKQAVQQFQRYVRKTDQMDSVEAGNISRKTPGLYNLNTHHTIMVSRKDTRIDGEHIHMG